MQRRAAAVYFVLFLVLGAGAYGFMQVGMSSPEVNLGGPTYAQGDTFTVNGTDFTVTAVEAKTESGGHGGGTTTVYTGELTWFNESNIARATIENDSTIGFQGEYRVDVDGGTNRSFRLVNVDDSSDSLSIYIGERFTYIEENVTGTVDSIDSDGVTLVSKRSASLQNGSTTMYQGGQYRVSVPNGTNVSSFTLVDDGNGSDAVSGNPSFSVGDQYEYQTPNVSATATVAGVSGGNVSLAWENAATVPADATVTFRDDYTTFIANSSNATSLTLTRERNVTNILTADQRVENQTLTRGGEKYVRYVPSGRTEPFADYIGEPYSKTLKVNDSFYYLGEDASATVTLDSVSAAQATVAWNSPANETIGFREGENVTVAGQMYFAHFPSENTVQVLPTDNSDNYYAQYSQTLSEIDYFHERRNGMWGIVIVSLLAGIVLLAAAYMPVK